MSGVPFKYEGAGGDDNGGYYDFEFSDSDLRKFYRVSYSVETASWYGVIQTSETDDGPFDGDNEMPDAMVRQLRALIPAADLPKEAA